MPLFGQQALHSIATGSTSYAMPGFGGTGTTAWANGVCKFIGLILPQGSWDQLAVETTVAGSSDSQYRLGLYTDNNGKPGTLVVDGGLTSSTGVGVQTVSITAATAMAPYWLAAVSQNATSPATVRYADSMSDPFFGGHTNANNFNHPQRGWTATVAGAFPTAAPTVSAEANPTIVEIRRLS